MGYPRMLWCPKCCELKLKDTLHEGTASRDCDGLVLPALICDDGHSGIMLELGGITLFRAPKNKRLGLKFVEERQK